MKHILTVRSNWSITSRVITLSFLLFIPLVIYNSLAHTRDDTILTFFNLDLAMLLVAAYSAVPFLLIYLLLEILCRRVKVVLYKERILINIWFRNKFNIENRLVTKGIFFTAEYLDTEGIFRSKRLRLEYISGDKTISTTLNLDGWKSWQIERMKDWLGYKKEGNFSIIVPGVDIWAALPHDRAPNNLN